MYLMHIIHLYDKGDNMDKQKKLIEEMEKKLKKTMIEETIKHTNEMQRMINSFRPMSKPNSSEIHLSINLIYRELFPNTFDIINHGMKSEIQGIKRDWRPIALETLYQEIGSSLDSNRLDEVCSIRHELVTLLEDIIKLWERN